MMWRCLSDLGGQSDLWSDVDTRRTGEGSVGARVGSDGAVWHDLRIRFLRVRPLSHSPGRPTNGSQAVPTVALAGG